MPAISAGMVVILATSTLRHSELSFSFEFTAIDQFATFESSLGSVRPRRERREQRAAAQSSRPSCEGADGASHRASAVAARHARSSGRRKPRARFLAVQGERETRPLRCSLPPPLPLPRPIPSSRLASRHTRFGVAPHTAAQPF